MIHPTLGGLEAQDSPITYHLEVVVVEEEEAVEEEEVVEEVEEVAEEVVILEIKMIRVLDKAKWQGTCHFRWRSLQSRSLHSRMDHLLHAQLRNRRHEPSIFKGNAVSHIY